MNIRILYITLLLVMLPFMCVKSQEKRVVTGSVSIDTADPGLEVEVMKDIVIYTFIEKKDVDEAIEILKTKPKEKIKFYFDIAKPDPRIMTIGEFKLTMPASGGYLLVWCPEYTKCPHALYEHRTVSSGMNIVLKYDDEKFERTITEKGDTVRQVRNVTITAERIGAKGSVSASAEEGGVMESEMILKIPYRVKPNMRVAVQPMWYDRVDIGNENSDTLFSYGKIVYRDRNEYKTTLTRLMDFDLMRDTIYSMASDSTTRYVKEVDGHKIFSNIQFSPKNDTIFVHVIDTVSGFDPDYSHPYPFGVVVAVGDYNTIIYKETEKDEGERRAPLKFLDFTFKEFLPDKKKFKVKMENRSYEAPGELKLNFQQGRAVIVPNDSSSRAQLDNLRATFAGIKADSSRTLAHVTVYGMASPEGNLSHNKELARKRAQYAMEQIKTFTERSVQMYEPQVAPWSDVVELLIADGLTEEADELNTIIAAHPGDIMAQGRRIAALGCYETIKERYLPMLRTVRYNYKVNIEDQLPPDTVLQRYREGNFDSFKRGEYWTLFNFIEDKNELEGVVKHAHDVTRNTDDSDSVYCKGYWPYAACLLACCYIARDTVDLDVLSPFLDLNVVNDTVSRLRFQRNSSITTNRIVEYINYPEVAANQLIMVLKQPNSPLRRKIPVLEAIMKGQGLEYDTLAAISKCMRGGYKPGNVSNEDEAQRIRNIVSSTSATNYVIINLAMDEPGDTDTKYLDAAEEKSAMLPDNAVSDYLKAVIKFRKNDNLAADSLLAESFVKDPKMIAIAYIDQDLISADGSYKVVTGGLRFWNTIMSGKVEGKEDHPYTWWAKAFAELNKGSYADVELAKEYMYRCFELDKRYLRILSVSIKSDKEIVNNALLTERLREIRSEYDRE